MNKTLIIVILCLIIFVGFVFVVCKDSDKQVDQNNAIMQNDSLKNELYNLKSQYATTRTRHQDSIAKYQNRIDSLKLAQQNSNKLHNLIIQNIRKLSNDSAHAILKSNYTPTEALTKITQLDSCGENGQYLTDLLYNCEHLNDLNTVMTINQQIIIDSCFHIADTCLIMLDGLTLDNERVKSKNARLKKWCKSFAGIALTSILINVIMFVK